MTLIGDPYLDDNKILHPDNAAAAIIMTSDGRYLLQLRDNKVGIFFPGCWGCFGGAIDPTDADTQSCILRELEEELGLALSSDDIFYFSNFTFDLSFCDVGVIYRTFYEVRLSPEQFAGLRLGEGSAFRAVAPQEAFSLLRLVPYDAFVLWLHFNQRRLTPKPPRT